MLRVSLTDMCSHLIPATRAILHNITVPEDAGRVRISIPRFGDLTLRSEGTLIPKPTSPEEASGRVFLYLVLMYNKVGVISSPVL